MIFSHCAWTLYASIAVAHSASHPSWVDHHPTADAEYKYYVGRASSVPGEAEAFRLATLQAREQAIAENFGLQTQVKTENYESTQGQTSSRQSQELSKLVRIQDFEQMNLFKQERPNGGVDLWLLFRYSLRSIQAEQKRIAQMKFEEEGPQAFTEQGSEADAANGVLEVTSYPMKAEVQIDGKRWGLTPLRLKGMLASGSHLVEVDHPRFVSVNRTIQIFPAMTARVSEKLEPAFAHIRIKTYPLGATVIVNGKSEGVSPTSLIPVPAGATLHLEIHHPETHAYVRDLLLEKDEIWEDPIVLSSKPSYLSIQSNPTGSTITLEYSNELSDERTQVEVPALTPSGLITVRPGTYTVILNKKGYETAEASVSVRGGETQFLHAVKLTPLSDRVERLSHPRFLVSFVAGGSSSTTTTADLPVGLYGAALEYKPGFLGFRAAYEHGDRSIQFTDGTLSFDTNRVTLGLPFYLTRSFYVAPEWMMIWNDYSIYSPDTDTTQKIKGRIQRAYGGSVGFRWHTIPSETSWTVFHFGIGTGVHRIYDSSDGAADRFFFSGRVECGLGF